MRRLLLCISSLIAATAAQGQYAPQAGIAGSTAISKSSSVFVAWATGCQLQRGLQQIGNASSGLASLGDASSAMGAPDGNVVSLGDSGLAVLTFTTPIVNGPGPDFAVFENGFLNTFNAEEAFLELAFVEVSSDGVNFFRFPATSKTQDTSQLSPSAPPSYINAREINNLAGKYISNWGTPFDLNELGGTPGLDVNAITHVRLVDVIGSIGALGTKDASGHKINDPFPSPFPGSGFDLDAVGVINAMPAGVKSAALEGIRIFPNPASDKVEVILPYNEAKITLSDATGRVIQRQVVAGNRAVFAMASLTAGTYFITIQSPACSICSAMVLHY
jgi:hypothetical protein